MPIQSDADIISEGICSFHLVIMKELLKGQSVNIIFLMFFQPCTSKEMMLPNMPQCVS